jgi:hypothetical protein
MMVFPGWFLKTEYRFADYDTRDVAVTSTGITASFVERIHPSVQTIRTVLTYTPGPVVAKY